ncbi:MAG: hypothetical protein Marn2KO_34040 [Marinobacter nauticus]
MSVIESFVAFANEIFRPFLLISSSAFAVYFACKKIGHKVLAQYSVGGDIFTPFQIKEVVFSNKKDKPVSIYSIYAVFEKDLWIELEKFSPPATIKPFESASFKIEPYSYLSVSSDDFEPDYMKARIYIESDDHVIECKSLNRPELINEQKRVSKNKCQFAGFTYNENLSHIILHVMNGKKRCAFIDKSGYIGNEWGFSPNHLGEPPSKENIVRMLRLSGLDKAFESYIVYKVSNLANITVVASSVAQEA